MGNDAAQVPAKTAGRARILVVDDARLVRVMITGILQRAGFDVAQASDGASALESLARDAYDVVITDLKMPGVDGFGVLASVKRTSPDVEVIILTGTHSQDVNCAVRALRLGAHDYLSKPPANADEVVLTVERALEKKFLKDANQRLVRELESLSRKDGLTGVLNRRCFDEALTQELSRARRHGHQLGVVMLDIDHFKAINDAHGHPGGDEVLRSFALTVKQTLREGDTLFRYGGEEFVALLPHADREGAMAAAERIVSAVAAAPVLVDRQSVRVTTSAGVACLGRSTRSGEELLANADSALYEAKKSGRNRAVLHGRRLALVSGGRGA
jgi:two-component system, cell cycle response regulator